MPEDTMGREFAVGMYTEAQRQLQAGDFKKALASMQRARDTILQAAQMLRERRAAYLRQFDEYLQNGLPAGATQEEQDFFELAVQTGRMALLNDYPTPDDFAFARVEQVKALRLYARVGELSDLAGRNATVAGAAHAAFDQMRAITGGGEVTDQRIADADAAATASGQALAQAEQDLLDAGNIPIITDRDIITRANAVRDATRLRDEARQADQEAKGLARALLGTKLLAEALDTGPLSMKGAGRKLPDAVASDLIDAFTTHPRLAADTVDIAQDAMDPEAVVQGIATVGAQLDAGFVSATGAVPYGFDAHAYALDLLKMGGTCGADYFARLNDYISNDGLMDLQPLPDDPTNRDSRGTRRCMAVAGELMDMNGNLDLNRADAKKAVGKMLFHPATMADPTPAMNKHMLKALRELDTQPLRAQAAHVINNTPAANTPAAVALVNAATGGHGNPSNFETRQAILAAMLQSVDQGPVGSCFATAPARKLRDVTPLTAMQTFRELAVNGRFTSAKGPPPTPAVINIPPGENPLIRSMEYTIATAMGQDAAMDTQRLLSAIDNRGAYGVQQHLIANPVAGLDANNIALRIKTAVRAEFTPVYDPTILNAQVAGDGRSDRGRYVMYDQTGARIDTRADYQARVEQVALAATGYAATSPEGQAIVQAVQQGLMAELDGLQAQGVDIPWYMTDGGLTEEAVETVFGAMVRTPMVAELPAVPAGDVAIGQRTVELMENLMGAFGTAADDMLLVRAEGIHGFNALPNHPSVLDLMQGPGTAAQKLQDKLVQPGLDLAAAQLDTAEAVAQFDKLFEGPLTQLEQEARNMALPEQQRARNARAANRLRQAMDQYRPTAPCTPGGLQALVTQTANASRCIRANAIAERLGNQLASAYAEPQVVIADPNWGDDEMHVFFVVAPDPVSGHPKLWKRIDPPGTLEAADPKWLKASWMTLE
ncbi:MAG: hypothetical protein CML68_10215 [Rhodobacteraceae bacterium]|nr:hypothetical protein [Paracoccaceae bacterium]